MNGLNREDVWRVNQLKMKVDCNRINYLLDSKKNKWKKKRNINAESSSNQLKKVGIWLLILEVIKGQKDLEEINWIETYVVH